MAGCPAARGFLPGKAKNRKYFVYCKIFSRGTAEKYPGALTCFKQALRREDSMMLCPRCKSEMKKGTLHGRGDNFFLPEGEKHPKFLTQKILERKHAVPLPPESFGGPFCEHWPVAFWCSGCKLLIADYSNLM